MGILCFPHELCITHMSELALAYEEDVCGQGEGTRLLKLARNFLFVNCEHVRCGTVYIAVVYGNFEK